MEGKAILLDDREIDIRFIIDKYGLPRTVAEQLVEDIIKGNFNSICVK
jgi:hypothetical protein